MIVDSGKYYLYRHIRLDKNEVFYIGIGTKYPRDINNPLHSVQYTRAYKKDSRNSYWDNIVKLNPDYEIEVIVESDELPFIKEKEIEFISIYKRKEDGGTLCNINKGGDGNWGYNHTEKTKSIIREKRAKQVITEEHKLKTSKKHLGKVLSQETKDRISRGNLGKKKSESHCRAMLFRKNRIKIKEVQEDGNIKYWDRVTDIADYYKIKMGLVYAILKNPEVKRKITNKFYKYD